MLSLTSTDVLILSKNRKFPVSLPLIFGYSIIVSFLCISCEKKLGKTDYIHFVRNYDNGLHVKSDQGDFLFDVQFQPNDYVRLLRGEVNGVNTKSLDDLQYYILNLSVIANTSTDIIEYNATGDADIQKRNYYYSYLFENDIVLEECGKQVPCALFHFERQSDIRNARTFVLGFKQCDASSNESKLIIHSPYLGSLPVKIKILKENIPSLKYD